MVCMMAVATVLATAAATSSADIKAYDHYRIDEGDGLNHGCLFAARSDRDFLFSVCNDNKLG